MPSLLRLLATLGVLVLGIYGALFSLATFLEPEPRAIVQGVTLPQDVNVKTGRSAATDIARQARSLTGERHASRRDR